MRRAIQILCVTALLAMPAVAQAQPPEEPVESILCRGASGEGFSYWWGGECWLPNGCTPDHSQGVGVCDGCGDGDGCASCTASSGCCNLSASCSHSGPYGADCSGFVSKAWQVPYPQPLTDCSADRFRAVDFTSDHAYWDPVDPDFLQPGDAVASSAHVILVMDYENSSGQHEVVEASGCFSGIVRHIRSLSSYAHGARRINLTSCVCVDGDAESESCGDCGTRTRTCVNDCLWSAWSPCEGPDPTGADTACTVDGEGQCGQGTRLCVAGWLTCQGKAPSAELCDGVDNDCDGVVDNGTPESLGEGLPCHTACGAGTSQCIDGAVFCVTPGGDTCDATDPPNDPGAGGCNCRTGATGALPALALALLLGLLAFRRRR